MGTVIGFYALFLAKCMEIFVYLLMAPARVAHSIHINTIKLIVRLLENTPGGVRVLKALNGYVSTDASVHTEQSMEHENENNFDIDDYEYDN